MDTVQVIHVGCSAGGLAMQVPRRSRMHDYLSRPHEVRMAVTCQACGQVMAENAIRLDETHTDAVASDQAK